MWLGLIVILNGVRRNIHQAAFCSWLSPAASRPDFNLLAVARRPS